MRFFAKWRGMLNQVPLVAAAWPTLTTVATLEGGVQDTPLEIAFADLAAAANESADTVAFRVKAISSGTLALGETEVRVGMDLRADQTWTWTPAESATGELDAFTVVAWNGAHESATAIQVKANVAAPSPGYNETAQDWADRVETNGGDPVSGDTLQAVSDFCDAVETNGYDDYLVSVMMFVPDNLIASLTPIYQTGGNDPWTNANFVSGDLTEDGLKGDGATTYCDSGLVPSSVFTAGKYGMFAFVTELAQLDPLDPPSDGTGGVYCGATDSTTDPVNGSYCVHRPHSYHSGVDPDHVLSVSYPDGYSAVSTINDTTTVGCFGMVRDSGDGYQFQFVSANAQLAQSGTVADAAGTQVALTPFHGFASSWYFGEPYPDYDFFPGRLSFLCIFNGAPAGLPGGVISLGNQLRVALGGGDLPAPA